MHLKLILVALALLSASAQNVFAFGGEGDDRLPRPPGSCAGLYHSQTTYPFEYCTVASNSCAAG